MAKVLILISGIALVAVGFLTILGIFTSNTIGVALSLGIQNLVTNDIVLSLGILIAGIFLLIEGARAK